jgi:LysR family glycine cleavage system transcriptional activator
MKRRAPPPLNFVRSFEAAARHLSFTRAAEELGYTQAAVSTHIRGLEAHLGQRLFSRRARSVGLTEVGETLLPTLRQALQQIDGAAEAIAKAGRERSVVLSCPMSLAEGWLPGVLARFRAVQPGVEVLVQGTIWERDEVETADIVISVRRADEVPANCRLLLAERLVMVCAPGVLVGGPAEALALPQIRVSGRQEYFAAFAAAHGVEDVVPTSVLRTNGSNISLELAAAGLGVAITVETLARPFLARGALVAPFAERYPSPWGYYVATPSRRLSGAARALLECLEGAARAG